MNYIAAVISMLHEPAQGHSALRRFRNKPVLQWTLARLQQSAAIDSATILCWDDQQQAVLAIDSRAEIISKGPRQHIPGMAAISTARRWADGWRGGLLGTCEFDLGFHPQWVHDIADSYDADAVVLIDPAAGLIDPVLVDRLVEHAESQPNAELCFAPAAPGLCGTLLRRELVNRLTVARIHPGRLLTYWPDQFGVDPLGRDGCAPVPTPVARSTARFKLDSHRQITRMDRATVSFNGHLISTEAEELAHRMPGCENADLLPRDITLEITTRRSTRPVFNPAGPLNITRADLDVSLARKLFLQLATLDDIRLSLAGVGDPLLHPQLCEMVVAAHESGIHSVHVETDGVFATPGQISQLIAVQPDIISVHLPAATRETYHKLMGINAFDAVMQNIRLLEQAARQTGSGLPLIVPIFTKTNENLQEMDAWYDYWLRRLGHAVIAGPSDFAGQIADTAVADMSPPKRRPCARLASRLTILSDGQVVSCEQDVLGKQVMGNIADQPIQEIWQMRFAQLRTCHNEQRWNEKPLCSMCREWHRP